MIAALRGEFVYWDGDNFTLWLDVNGVTLQYKTKRQIVTASYQVDFQIYPGDRFVLLGPSGCGKSTLLKGVGGFLDPVEGSINLNGKPVHGPGPDRMMIFQESDQLLPWKTVLDNVVFPMITSGKYGAAEAKERAREYLDKVNLTDFCHAYPHELSGGMKQRVAIARGMAMSPAVLLMDEPFASLDALTRLKMQQELLQLWDELRFTVLFVTHQIEEAVYLSDRVIVMTKRPGRAKRIIDVGLKRPRDYEMRVSQEFNELRLEIWNELKDELNARGDD